MVIQSQKTGRQESVTPEQWENFKKTGFAKNWVVVSRDEPVEVKKIIPKEIIEFQKVKPPKGKKQ